MIYVGNAFSLQMLPSLEVASTVRVEPLTVDEVRNLLQEGFVSAIGHADTANVVSDIVGERVEQNRISVSLTPSDTLIVCQVVGGRLPEGATTLPQGVTLKFVKVTLL